ncbi:MAG: hypothetical protein U9O94_03215 [Nanoarchaeota archaeon]|nr:hypothetical protein [Nanoarchaeota archaeon]
MNTIWEDNNQRKIASSIIILLGFILLSSLLFYGEEPNFPINSMTGIGMIVLVMFVLFAGEYKKKYASYKIFFLMLLLFLILIFALGFFTPKSWSGIVYYLGIIIFMLALLYMAYIMLRVTMSKVVEEGILLGTAYIDNEKDIILQQKKTLFKWKDIRKIQLKGKITAGGLISQKHQFIHITTKNNLNQNCYLVDKSGFMNGLKKANKINILVK